MEKLGSAVWITPILGIRTQLNSETLLITRLGALHSLACRATQGARRFTLHVSLIGLIRRRLHFAGKRMFLHPLSRLRHELPLRVESSFIAVIVETAQKCTNFYS
jgi:hypothetical protein